MSARAPLRALSPLLLLAGLLAPLAAQDRSPGALGSAQGAAAAWLDQARGLFASGAMAAADDFALRALDFLPQWSDALYLRARIALASRLTTRQGIALASAAIEAASWTTADPDEAASTLGDTLARTRQYGTAIPMLEGAVGRRPELPAPLASLARAYELSGRTDDALAAARRGWRLFPSQSGFVVLASRILEGQGRRDEAFRLASEAVALSPTDTTLLLRAAVLERDPARRSAAVDRYTAAGGADPLAATIGLEASPEVKYLDQFLASGGLGRGDLVERTALAIEGNTALARSLGDAMKGYSGERTLDADLDGWWEQRWRYASGVISDWTFDQDQDGVPELVETFGSAAAGVVPLSLQFHPDPVLTFTAFYSAFPLVERIAEQGPSGDRTWYLSPGALAVPFLAEHEPKLPTPAEVLAASQRFEELGSGGTVVRSVRLDAGRRTYVEEDSSGDGRVDHKLWYVDGSPDHGLRDLTGDGTFPVRETWRGGKLQSETADTNGDGAPDYQEVFLPTPVKLWDYDEDGRWDSRQSAGAGATVVREISSKLDGRFDVRVVFSAGRISSISRSGASIAATADAARGVTWIGAVAKGAIPDPAGPDGLRVIGGRRYLLFRHEAVTYLEELP